MLPVVAPPMARLPVRVTPFPAGKTGPSCITYSFTSGVIVSVLLRGARIVPPSNFNPCRPWAKLLKFTVPLLTWRFALALSPPVASMLRVPPLTITKSLAVTMFTPAVFTAVIALFAMAFAIPRLKVPALTAVEPV